MIASSKSKNLKDHGLDTSFYSRDIVMLGRNGPWYYKKDKPELHCTELNQAVTEFGCQGLELDGILVGWGRDYYWSKQDQEWKSLRFTSRNKAKDPYQLRKNSYRVLLTRARDGMVIFCPQDKWMKDTYQFLVDIGITELDEMSIDNASTVGKNGNGNGH
jgi:hypothetical protein